MSKILPAPDETLQSIQLLGFARFTWLKTFCACACSCSFRFSCSTKLLLRDISLVKKPGPSSELYADLPKVAMLGRRHAPAVAPLVARAGTGVKKVTKWLALPRSLAPEWKLPALSG